MKKLILPILFATFALFACEDVIDVELDEGEHKINIEAFIETSHKPEVIVSRTKAYNDQSSIERLAGVEITITDDSNPPKSATFYEVDGEGYYTTEDDYLGEEGRVYTLSVTYKEKTYTAIDTLKRNAELESVYVKKDDEDDEYYNVYLTAQEPSGRGDYYRWVVICNGEPLLHPAFMHIQPDEWVDGNLVKDMEVIDGDDVEYFTKSELIQGATIQVKQMSISKSCFEFYEQYQRLSYGQGLFSPPPANLPTNFSNGAIGFFRASSVVYSDELVIGADE